MSANDAVIFRGVRAADLEFLSERMRQSDRTEAWLAEELTPGRAVRLSVERSRKVVAAVSKGGLLCLFGEGDLGGGDVSPWLLGTDLLQARPLALARHTKAIVAQMRADARRLVNYVHADNMASCRWLEWAGFRLCVPKPYGPFGALFRRFTMKGKLD